MQNDVEFPKFFDRHGAFPAPGRDFEGVAFNSRDRDPVKSAHVPVAARRYDGNVIERCRDEHNERVAALKIFGDLLPPFEPERLEFYLQAFLGCKFFNAALEP